MNVSWWGISQCILDRRQYGFNHFPVQPWLVFFHNKFKLQCFVTMVLWNAAQAREHRNSTDYRVSHESWPIMKDYSCVPLQSSTTGPVLFLLNPQIPPTLLQPVQQRMISSCQLIGGKECLPMSITRQFMVWGAVIESQADWIATCYLSVVRTVLAFLAK